MKSEMLSPLDLDSKQLVQVVPQDLFTNHKSEEIKKNLLHEEKDCYSLKEINDLEITEIPWLWENIFPQTGLGFITGPSDSNKSTFLRQLALSIITEGEEFLGIKLNTRKKKVLFVCTEDNVAGIASLVHKQKTRELPNEVQERLLFYFKPIKKGEELEKIVGSEGIDLLILDTWTDGNIGDLNSTVSVRSNLEIFKQFSKKHNCFVLCVHHTRKGAENQEPNKNLMLGSQGIEACSRVVMDIRRAEGQNRVLTVVKSNYAPDGIKKNPIFLRMDNETMLFERISKPDGYGLNSRSINEDFFKADVEECLKNEFSQNKTEKYLKAKYPNEHTPSKGKLNAMIKAWGFNNLKKPVSQIK